MDNLEFRLEHWGWSSFVYAEVHLEVGGKERKLNRIKPSGYAWSPLDANAMFVYGSTRPSMGSCRHQVAGPRFVFDFRRGHGWLRENREQILSGLPPCQPMPATTVSIAIRWNYLHYYRLDCNSRFGCGIGSLAGTRSQINARSIVV